MGKEKDHHLTAEKLISYMHHKYGQSMTELQQMLAQVRARKLSATSNSSCLTCLRNSSQKYCYDSRTGDGECCAMDSESKHCDQSKNPRLVCSTDKIIARSAGYEVCPHDAKQCDTKTLVLNNETTGKLLDGKTQDSTRSLIAKEGPAELGNLSMSGIFEGYTISKSSVSPELKGTPVTDAIEVEVDPHEQAKKLDNQVAKAPLIDDSYWRSIVVNSENGTVCSYELLNSDTKSTNNVFEIQISSMKNLQIGLYYGQYDDADDMDFELTFEPVFPLHQTDEKLDEQMAKYSRLVDLKIFSPEECSDLMHCTSSSEYVSDDDHYI